MSLLKQGEEKGYIKFNADKSYITYVHPNKKRNFNNPEEKVQAEAYLTLIINYNYPVERIKVYVSVQMGAETKEADIIVYSDKECKTPYIVVECKKEEVTEQEFSKGVDQAYSYADRLQAKFIWVTSKIKDEYYEVVEFYPSSRSSMTDLPPFGVNELAPYKYVKGGLKQNIDEYPSGTKDKENKQKFFELVVVSESDLTKIFIQAHQALWGGGQRNPSVAFDELDKLIFCKVWDEKRPRKNGQPYEFQLFRNEPNEELLKRIKSLYDEGKKRDPEVFKEDISLSPAETSTIVKYLQRINLNKTDLDSKGKAFETFMGSFFRGDFGQYFTPRPIVKFIVDTLPINNSSRVLDTSCGSGGFLLHALDKVRQQADDYYDIVKEEKDHYKYWHDFAEKNLYGIEINDQIARTAKMNMIIHDDGHTNVVSTDGLISADYLLPKHGESNESIEKREKHNQNTIQGKTGNFQFKYNSFDFIITNPPFGSSIKQTEKAYLHQYQLGKKEEDWLAVNALRESVRESQSTEILFIEQCYKYLVENGYLAIVIPDGILTNSSLQYVRDSIEEMYRIVAIVSLPQTAFTATGAGVKSSVMFLRKNIRNQTERITSQKSKIKNQLKKDSNFTKTVEDWENEKKLEIKRLENEAKAKDPKATKKEIAELIKDKKATIQSSFIDKVYALKEELTEKYYIEKQKILDDYPIFMAIAEEIGYDAIGRKTGKNELIEISKELSKFVTHINKTEL